MQVEFDKMEGAGNDFILVDNRDLRFPSGRKRDIAIRHCRRGFGIGADGFVFVENDPEFDFAWDFYNPDGSRAEMCGNGARCVARFANKIGAAGVAMTFRSIAGPIRAELTQRGAKVKLTDVVLPEGPETIDVDGEKIRFWFLDSGVPHAVVETVDLPNFDVTAVGRRLRRHGRFAPEGTNVNFFTPDAVGDRLSIRTYERGVEEETLACGTGSVATCIVAGRFFGKGSPLVVTTRGGEELVIHFTLNGGMARDVFLEGGARLVYSGVFTL